MRRVSIVLAGLILAGLAVAGSAAALPTVKFKAKAVPIKGFPHTGNILGAGAAIQAEYTIIGTEYGWIEDPWSTVRDEHKNWEKAMDLLRKDGWDNVNFESINAGVHYVYWMPPERWQKILWKRINDRMNP